MTHQPSIVLGYSTSLNSASVRPMTAELRHMCGRKIAIVILGRGVKKRSRMPLLGVIGGGDYDGDLRDAEKKKAAGFIAYKIKVGVDAPRRRMPRARAKSAGCWAKACSFPPMPTRARSAAATGCSRKRSRTSGGIMSASRRAASA
jgi:hypothetical protein